MGLEIVEIENMKKSPLMTGVGQVILQKEDIWNWVAVANVQQDGYGIC